MPKSVKQPATESLIRRGDFIERDRLLKAAYHHPQINKKAAALIKKWQNNGFASA
jgi:hypothetical protein